MTSKKLKRVKTESRKDQLYYRIKRDYIRNVIATIPCNISSYSDVIRFSESYKDPDYTESDVETLYSKIEKDVYETIQNQE